MSKFRCPACKTAIPTEGLRAGRLTKCPGCGKTWTVPRSPQPAPSGKKPPARAEKKPEPSAVKTPKVKRSVFWTPAFCVGIGAVGLLAVLMLPFGGFVTAAFLVIVGLSVLNGRMLGAARVAAGVVGMVMAMLLAWPLGRGLEGVFAAICGTSGLVNRMISIGGSGVLVAAIVGVGVSIPIRRYMKKRPALQRFDRVIGTGLGAVDGVLFAVILLWGALAIEPLAARTIAQAAESDGRVRVSPAARAVVAVARSARHSVVGHVAGVANPLKSMRVVTLLDDAQEVLSDPEKREALLNHPAIKALQERQSVKDTLERLAAEPNIVDLDDGLDEAEVRELMKNPRFLAILDETGLLSDLSAVIADAEAAINSVRDAQP